MGWNSCPSCYLTVCCSRPCSPCFVSGRENCQEKLPPDLTTAFSRNHPPAAAKRFPVPLRLGVLLACPLTFLWRNVLSSLAAEVPPQSKTAHSNGTVFWCFQHGPAACCPTVFWNIYVTKVCLKTRKSAENNCFRRFSLFEVVDDTGLEPVTSRTSTPNRDFF